MTAALVSPRHERAGRRDWRRSICFKVSTKSLEPIHSARPLASPERAAIFIERRIGHTDPISAPGCLNPAVELVALTPLLITMARRNNPLLILPILRSSRSSPASNLEADQSLGPDMKFITARQLPLSVKIIGSD